LEAAQALLEQQQNISIGDRDRLLGYLEGGGKIILPEPQPLLTKAAKMPGLDGQKMSKSYGNTIPLSAEPAALERQLRTMPTDPARVRRTDPGDPERCPVWQFHLVYSGDQVLDWVREGCTSAGIGCVECKQPVIDAVLAELKPIQERAREYEADLASVRNIIDEGCERARSAARETMADVRAAMSLEY
jgi:tryptophanyl-tRNA synthetase